MPLLPGDVPSRQGIQDAIDEAVADALTAIQASYGVLQSGKVILETNTNGSASATLTFPEAFPGIPRLVGADNREGALGGNLTIAVRFRYVTPVSTGIVVSGGPASSTAEIAWIGHYKE